MGLCFRGYYLLAVVGILLLSACASQPIMLKADAKPKTLELCLDFREDMNSVDKLYYLDAANAFIVHYNNLARGFNITPCAEGKKQTVRLIIENSRFVSPAEQTMYTLISILGIAYPLSGGGFGFAWLGFSTTSLGVQLSPDIADTTDIVYTQFSSSPYFYDEDSVKIKHMKQFQAFMFELFDGLRAKRSAKSES